MRVPGYGPRPCDILMCAEEPSIAELRAGEPFAGRAARDFNESFLPALGLRRGENVFLTTLYRTMVAKGAPPRSADDKAYDLTELRTELAEVTPKLIVPIGAEATRYFLGDDANLDEVHGILWHDPNCAGRFVFPCAHIAAYTPELQSRVAYDFQQLHDAMYGGMEPWTLWLDPYPSPTYIEVPDAHWLAAALHGVRTIHIDTEGIPGQNWSLQFAIHPGTAYLVRVTSRRVLLAFFQWLLSTQPRVVFHGSLHDFGIFREMLQSLGLDIEALYAVEFDDTQIMAYLLQLEPIGLKPNCVRHCSMRMQDYMEVLGDAQLLLAQDYLIRIFDHEQARYRQAQHAEFARINATPLLDVNGNPKRTKSGEIRYRKTTVLPEPPRTALHKAAERVLRSGRPYQLWQDQTEDIRVAAYNLEVE